MEHRACVFHYWADTGQVQKIKKEVEFSNFRIQSWFNNEIAGNISANCLFLMNTHVLRTENLKKSCAVIGYPSEQDGAIFPARDYSLSRKKVVFVFHVIADLWRSEGLQRRSPIPIEEGKGNP